jgi:hypothetical protein
MNLSQDTIEQVIQHLNELKVAFKKILNVEKKFNGLRHSIPLLFKICSLISTRKEKLILHLRQNLKKKSFISSSPSLFWVDVKEEYSEFS